MKIEYENLIKEFEVYKNLNLSRSNKNIILLLLLHHQEEVQPFSQIYISSKLDSYQI